ncbi:MAG: hypothetical protein LBR10_03335 [Prevotellaceae bacterium]|jgi:hypothetical protein|nr:hypothetical protein [Prevotellaceae bacterium]
MEIRETQIEDILISSPELMKNTLRLDEEPRLIGRQIIVPSGRLDMLYTYRKDLFLIELKIVTFQKKFIQQVISYRNDLQSLQRQGKLIQGNIQPFLLLPKINILNRAAAEAVGVYCKEYDPEAILKYFYSKKLRPITYFVENKPIDIGIWNIHLINKFIYHLEKTNSVKELQSITGGSRKTLYNKIKFAVELGLLNWLPKKDYITLSELGRLYVSAKDTYFENTLSEEQAKIIRKQVVEDPYHSSVILGIASMVECVFALSKTSYPVSLVQLESYFTVYSGKTYDWQTEKAQRHGAKMYSNYAADLGLMAKTDKNVYLTPVGFKFVIQLQLHKSLRLMNSLTVN